MNDDADPRHAQQAVGRPRGHAIGRRGSSQRPCSSPRRRGILLVEVMVAVALSGIVLGLVVTFVTALIQQSHRIRNEDLHCQHRAELAESVRASIRLGADAALDGPHRLTISLLPDERHTYELREGFCRRRVERGDEPDRVERFMLGAAEAWTFERSEVGRRPLMKIALERAESDVRRPPPWFVHAALGADRGVAAE